MAALFYATIKAKGSTTGVLRGLAVLSEFEKDLILKNLSDIQDLIRSLDEKITADRDHCFQRHQSNLDMIQKTKEDVAAIKGRWFVLATILPILISVLFQVFIRKT